MAKGLCREGEARGAILGVLPWVGHRGVPASALRLADLAQAEITRTAGEEAPFLLRCGMSSAAAERRFSLAACLSEAATELLD